MGDDDDDDAVDLLRKRASELRKEADRWETVAAEKEGHALNLRTEAARARERAAKMEAAAERLAP